MINIPTTAFSIVLALLGILASVLAWKATHSGESRFNFEEAFLDTNGKTSISRIGMFSALVVSTWAFVYMTVDGKMTEWYFTGYMGAWVLNGLGSKFLDKPSA